MTSCVSSSKPRSIFLKYPIIVSAEISVPSRPLIQSGSNAILLPVISFWYTSTTPPTTSPAPSSSMSWQARFIASMALFGSRPFSNLEEASVRRPTFLLDRRMFVPSKHAASNNIVCTLSVIMEFSPPMIPASPTAFSPSQIIRMLSSKVRS